MNPGKILVGQEKIFFWEELKRILMQMGLGNGCELKLFPF